MAYTVLNSIAKVAINELKQPSYSPEVAFVRRLKGRVNRVLGRSIRRPSYNYFWTTAILADGLLEYYKASRSDEALAALIEYHEVSKKLIGFRKPMYVDEVMNAHSLIEIHELGQLDWAGPSLARLARFLVYDHPKTVSGVLPYRSANCNVVLVDTIGMVCPFLSKYAVGFDYYPAMELAISQVMEFLEVGLSKESGLPFHGYSPSGETLGGEGWGRGVGWLLMGISAVLIEMPKDHSSYLSLLSRYNTMLGVVFSKQQSDGSFPEQLIGIKSQSDTSATSMIAYACAKSIECHTIDRTYLESCVKAYSYIKLRMDVEGRIQGASGEALGSNKYAGEFGWYPWGQGPSIGLGAVLKRLSA